MSYGAVECRVEFKCDGTRVVSFGFGDLSSSDRGEQFARYVQSVRCIVADVAVGREVEPVGLFDSGGHVSRGGGILSSEDAVVVEKICENCSSFDCGGLGRVGANCDCRVIDEGLQFCCRCRQRSDSAKVSTGSFRTAVMSEEVGTGDRGCLADVVGVAAKVGVEPHSSRGPNWERNRADREEKKLRKKKRQAMEFDWRKDRRCKQLVNFEDRSNLQKSVQEKWQAKNELETARARRQLEILKATDVEQEVKRYRTKVSAATERNMVSIERTHAKLRQTGNLPEERSGGFAETVVSDVPGLESGSGTISPDSSASMAEFRACQKALLDAERENAEYKRKIKIASEKYGFPLEQVDFLDKEVWTDTQTNQDILDEIYPNGYGKDTSLFEDGKFRAIGV